jgi:predicted permease
VKLIYRIAGGLRALWRRNQVESELDDELREFLQRVIERNISRGMGAEEAERAARIEVGSIDVVKESVRDVGWESRIDSLWQDIRYAARRLARSPGFTIVAAVTLGLGIGGNLAIFNLCYQVLIEPLPYQNPDQLVAIWGDASYRNVAKSETPPPDFRDWQRQATTFSDLAAYSYGSALTLPADDGPQLIDTLPVTANFFHVLGANPAQGRWFGEVDDDAGAPRVAVASHGFWQRHFGGRQGLEGAAVQGYEIVGVMPEGFQFAQRNTDLWIPLMMSEREWARRGNNILLVVGRLKPGLTAEDAQAEMNTIAANQAAAYPETNANRGVRVITLRDEFTGSVRTLYFVLFGAAAAVLLVACLSVAHLLLLRGSQRSREFAVRSSLGASRLRLAQQLLAESALLAISGTAVGLVLSQWTFGFFTAFIPQSISGFTELRVNGAVIVFAMAAGLITALIAGLMPALKLSGLQLSAAMQEGGRAGAAKHAHRLRDGIVICEIAVSVVLLVCSSVFIATILRLHSLNPGFDMKNLLTVQLRTRSAEYYDALLQRVTALPGVTSAGLGTVRPLQPAGGRRTLVIEGYSYRDASDQPRVLFRTISAGYLQTLRVPLLRGRTFDSRDVTGAPPAAIINDSMRRRYWGDRDPIGQRVQLYQEDSAIPNSPWYTVVGVAGDVRQRALDVDPEPELMVPYLQFEGGAFYRPRNLVVRTAGNPALSAETLRKEVQALDNSAPVEAQTMEDAAAAGLANRRPRTFLITAFAGMTLILSILGVYSLVSFAVAGRTQEIGVRLALGAAPAGIMRMFVKEGLALAAVGCAGGLIVSSALTQTLTTFLYGVAPTQPEFFAGVALVILSVAIAASYIPARRVRKIDPVIALRCE